MFCPRCATQNGFEQGYCRQCGQALSGVRVALEGNAEQSLKNLKAGVKWINGGSATLGLTLLAVAITILSTAIDNPTLSYIAIINFFLGASIGLPLIYVGTKKVKRAARLLTTSQPEPRRSTLGQTPQPELLTTGLNADLLTLPVPGSVAEHTTHNLAESGGQSSTADRPRKVP